ncbi:H-NS histone family protein [Ralstonia chuxiongensis]|uniref:H-NS histone family protein n=1 Tax=Ralstonia chuxiongensis TaxID=2957504 RepID=UPI002931E747|nr:H-NS histone family protein [Ralstonia chuxiongensis]
MGNYKELLEQRAQLQEQLEIERAKELEKVIQELRTIIFQYGLTAKDLGLAAHQRQRVVNKVRGAPKYQNPMTGATWSGRGRPPSWIGIERDKFLIR